MTVQAHQLQASCFSPAHLLALQNPIPAQATPIACPSDLSTRARAPQASNVAASFASLHNISSADDIRRASSEFADSHHVTPLFPHFNVTPPSGMHPEPATYAAEHSRVAGANPDPECFSYTQIGDLIIWKASTTDGDQVVGMTYVSPSNILSADLVIGVYRLVPAGQSDVIPDDCIARFSLLCHCIAVPKNRAFLMDNAPTFKSLNRREKQVLTASADGSTAREVAELLRITERTVNAYVQSAMEKLDCSCKLHAILRANRFGLI